MGIVYRKYKNYNEYVEHQKSKLKNNLDKFLGLYNKRYKNIHSRITQLVKISGRTSGKVLCLGARRGEEVQSFRELGFKDAFGIDLYPGPDNPYVVEGDFHNLKYSDKSFDILYTNSIDHTFDMEKMAKEASRVLNDSGLFFLEVSSNIKLTTKWSDEKGRSHLERKSYEAIIWDSPEDVVDLFKKAGDFEEVGRRGNSHSVVLRKR